MRDCPTPTPAPMPISHIPISSGAQSGSEGSMTIKRGSVSDISKKSLSLLIHRQTSTSNPLPLNKEPRLS